MDIFEAIRGGNLIEIESCIADKATLLSKVDGAGDTPLHLAIKKHLFLPTKKLIEAGAPLDAQNIHDKKTPLILATAIGDLTTAEMLITAGANPDIQDSNGNTPLIYAADKALSTLVQQLLDAGANLDIQGYEGKTALWKATLTDNPDLVKSLLIAGANPDIQDKWGWTPFHRAANANKKDLIQAFFDAKANPNIRDGDGKLPRERSTFYSDLIGTYQKTWGPPERCQITPAPKKKTPVGISEITIKNLAKLDQLIGRKKPTTELSAPPTENIIPEWKYLPPEMMAKVTILEAVNYRLTEVFNFETRQYISTTQNLQTGYETGNQREFDEIRDKTLLAKALSEFKNAGGKADEHVIDTGFRVRHKESLIPVRGPSLIPPSPEKGGL